MTAKERRMMGERGVQLRNTEFERDRQISTLLSWFDDLVADSRLQKIGTK